MSQEPELVALEPFRVVGLAARTTNADESEEDSAKIPGLWAEFARTGLAGRAAGEGIAIVAAAYSEYESDESGEYTLVVGCRREEEDEDEVPAGLRAVDVPGGAYLRFRGDGPLPDVVIETWQRILDYFEAEGAPGRSFEADVEVYDDRGVDVFVGVE